MVPLSGGAERGSRVSQEACAPHEERAISAARHHTTLPPRGQDHDKEGAPEPGTLLIEDETLRAGFTQIPNRVLHARNLSRDAKLLYGFLLSYAWQQGSCFPGYAQLCADMGASPSIVRKYLHELEVAGLLVQKRRGLGKTNLYTLCSLSTATLEPPVPPRRAETDDQDAPLSDALEGNPCSEEEDSTEKDTDEEGFDSKGTDPHADHADEGSVRQPIKGQPQSVGHGKARRPSATASERLVPTPPTPPAAAAPPALDVVLPGPDDQALVVLLAQLGDEFGDWAARSSLTRVRTLRHGLAVEEVTRHLDQAALLTRACRTVQPDKRMAYLLTVLENSMAAPPSAAAAPGVSAAQRLWRHPTTPTSLNRQGISQYIGGSYGVCAHCLSAPCEADCLTRTHEVAGPAAVPTARAVVQLPEMAQSSSAYS